MLSKSIRILNFDDSITNQRKLTSRYEYEVINLKDLAPRARLWMNKKTMKDIEERIEGSAKSSITFLGSGDFHHISSILISQFEQPLSLIIFDFHPDWDILPPHFGCGSWVTQTLKNKNILKCILIGVSSSDISNWWVQSGSLASLKDNRVEIYPYSHKPSLAFFKRIPQNVSIKLAKRFLYNKIYWDELKGKNLTEFFLLLLKRMPTKQVYISIDKDCLRKEYAITNWEEGLLSQEEFFIMLKLIKENLDIIGMDITGDYSKISAVGMYKRIFSKLDHPKDIAANKYPMSFINELNEDTNSKIMEVISSY